MFDWDGPAQLFGSDAREALRRAQPSVDEVTEHLSRAAAGLPVLFEFPITRDRVQNWLDERPEDRKPVFRNSLWAAISWDKSLGKPSTPQLADAFTFNLSYGYIKSAATSGEPIGEPVWVPLPRPLTWDGPHDEEHYRVSVLVRVKAGLHHRFSPVIRRDVEWDAAPRLSRLKRALTWPQQMVPHGQFFLYEGDDALVLDEEYKVVELF
jgi:hypothetical protein